MPDTTAGTGPRSGTPQAFLADRRARHLELVTDQWLAEQRGRLVRGPANRLRSLRLSAPRPGAERSLPRSGPLRPA